MLPLYVAWGDAGRIQEFATGERGDRWMLDHLRCAVGALHSQKIVNFGVSLAGSHTGSATGMTGAGLFYGQPCRGQGMSYKYLIKGLWQVSEEMFYYHEMFSFRYHNMYKILMSVGLIISTN